MPDAPATSVTSAPSAGMGPGRAPGRDHWFWRQRPAAAGPSVVFDIDGVLSDARGRQHFLDGSLGRKDWRGFFDACGDDPVIRELAQLLSLLDPSLRIVLLTGRPQRVSDRTLAWLGRHELRWDLLIMRPGGDFGPALEFKRTALGELRRDGFEPRLALEDDRRNHDMFVAEGVPCVYIHSGYYSNP
ncbi:MAG: phosphatase domain-containing protein [Acidimicrobiales bacterium]